MRQGLTGWLLELVSRSVVAVIFHLDLVESILQAIDARCDPGVNDDDPLPITLGRSDWASVI